MFFQIFFFEFSMKIKVSVEPRSATKVPCSSAPPRQTSGILKFLKFLKFLKSILLTVTRKTNFSLKNQRKNFEKSMNSLWLSAKTMISKVEKTDFLWQSQGIPWFLNSNLLKNWFFLWLSAKTMISRVPKPVFLWQSQRIHWFFIAKARSDLKNWWFSCGCQQKQGFPI